MVKKISVKQLDKIKADKKSSVISAKSSPIKTKQKAIEKAADNSSIKATAKAAEDTARTIQNLANMQKISNNTIERLVSQLASKLSAGATDYRLNFVRDKNELLEYIDITIKDKPKEIKH